MMGFVFLIQQLDFINSFGHQMKAENVPGPSSLGEMKTEMEVDDDDDDDEDDDMEEVS